MRPREAIQVRKEGRDEREERVVEWLSRRQAARNHRLEAGLERRRDTNDRRRYAIHLTRAGKTKLSRAREAVQLRADELLAPLSEDERETLHDLLARVAAAGERDMRPLA